MDSMDIANTPVGRQDIRHPLCPPDRRSFIAKLLELAADLPKPMPAGVVASTFHTVPDKRDVVDRLRAVEGALRSCGVVELWLFGSVARGTANFDSDVDLAAQMDWECEGDLLDALPLAARTLGRNVDIVELPLSSRMTGAKRDLTRVF